MLSGTAKTLPCGCVMDTVGDAFVYQPCSPDCQYYLYVQQQQKKKNMPISTIFDPDVTEEQQAAFLAHEKQEFFRG